MRLGMSISMMSPSSTSASEPPSAASGEIWPIAKSGGPAGEAPVRDERANFAQSLGLEIAGRIEHLLHSRTALWPFVANQHHVAGNDLVAENRFDGRVLALEDARRAGKGQVRRIDAGRLHDAAVLGDIAEENRQAAVLAEGVVQIADHAVRAIQVQLVVTLALAEGLRRAHAARSGAIKLGNRRGRRALHVQLVDGFAHGRRMNGVRGAMQQPGAVQFGQNGEDSAGAMHVFQMHVGRGGRHFAEIAARGARGGRCRPS